MDRSILIELFVLFVLLSVLCREARCVPLRERHHDYIANIIKQFQDSPVTLYVYPPIPMVLPSNPLVPNPIDYIRPVLMFWDPLNQLACLRGTIRCPRPECRISPNPRMLRAVHWKDCHNRRETCRLLYGVNGPIYLVSRVYRCTGQHAEIIAHDQAILNLIPESRRPFILSHIAGVTRELQDNIVSYIISGLKMEHIQLMMCQVYLEVYTRKRVSFEEDLQDFLSVIDIQQRDSEYETFPLEVPDEYKAPGVSVIRDCFIYAFEKKQCLYTKRMIEHSAEWISIDHTFKIAANIGVHRKCDLRWEKQYDSMFCVMNDIGCVIAWQLSSGTAFAKVEDLLKSLQKRFERQGRNVNLCFTDNCCSWMKKLQSVFGVGLTVKLDIFHAVQRIVKKIPKRHPFSFRCAQAFTLTFRRPHDHGNKRKDPTPSPEVMSKQLDDFVLTWKDVLFEEKPVLTLDALKEIVKLRVHIKKGCLSDIPPGCGTERNENLHKCLRKSACNVRIGVHIAVALFTTFLYVWNEKRKAGAAGKKFKVVPVIDSSDKLTVAKDKVDEKFGVGVSSERSFNAHVDTIPSSYCDLFADCNWDAKEHDLEDILENSDFILEKDDVKNILDKATNLASVVENLERSNGPNRTLNTDHLNLMSNPALFAFGTCIKKSGKEEASVECLYNTLASYNMEFVKSPPDGDCFFTSVIFGLKQIVSSKKYEKYTDYLYSLNLSFEELTTTVLQLRSLLVDEWLAHASEYKNFITSQETSFQQLANSYRSHGVFAGELGNIMVVGIANVLKINLVLFTSMQRMGTIPIVPRGKALISYPLYLAFNHSGCGHHDAVVESVYASNTEEMVQESGPVDDKSNKIDEKQNRSEEKGCRCGRGAARQNKKRTFCFQVPGERRTQCPCLRELKRCSQACNCCNCNNPHGKKSANTVPVKNIPKSRPRKREKHSLQGLRKTSLDYMIECGENPKDPNWNTMEKYVLKSLVDHIIEKGGALNEDDITPLYNELVDIVKELPGVNLLLSKKGKKTIKQMLKKVSQEAELFRQLYLQQVEENITNDE